MSKKKEKIKRMEWESFLNSSGDVELTFVANELAAWCNSVAEFLENNDN